MNKIGISATLQIIVITSLISLLAFIFSPIFTALQLVPSETIHDLHLWTLLTHIFVHGNFVHLFANMFSLWFIGRIAEKILGKKRFIGIYFASGILAGLLSVVLAYYFGFGIFARIFGSPTIAMVGASGAIFGLAGVLAALIPRARVYLIAGPLIAIIASAIVDSFASQGFSAIFGFIVTAYILFCLSAMFSFNSSLGKLALPISIPLWALPLIAILPLTIASIFIPLNIGNIAHLGGFVVGWAYGFYLVRHYPQKTMMLRRYFR